MPTEPTQIALEHVVDRLAGRFPALERAEIDRRVWREAAVLLDGARFETFVPVLTEHAVREELAHLRRD